MALLRDIQKNYQSLDDFAETTIRLLSYIPEVTTKSISIKEYKILESISGETKKISRPFNKNLLIAHPGEFEKRYKYFKEIVKECSRGKQDFQQNDFVTIDSVAYTIQQTFGIGFDILANPNSSRKHVGNRFEELVRLIVTEIGIANKKVVLKIPYEENNVYSCETDLVFSPFENVRSNSSTIDTSEVIVSLKTTSKDRMGKIFIDKMLMQKFVNHPVKVVGIFLNDIQRKEEKGTSFTFVAGLFMVYTKFLTSLEGIYFVDPPGNGLKSPTNKYISRFSDFILRDSRTLIGR